MVEKLVDIIDRNFDEHMGTNEAVLQAAEDINIIFKDLLKDILSKSQEHIILSGIRFEGTHSERIKQCFKNIGVTYQPPF